MALFLSEVDVQELLPMDRAIECVEASFTAQHNRSAVNHPRQRIFLSHLSFHYMAGALVEKELVGMKVYTAGAGEVQFLVLLFDGDKGDLLAIIEADHLGRIRTGAASGVATKYLARKNASRVGLVGTGRQARTQLEAIAAVRKIEAAKVFSRDKDRRLEFCASMMRRLNLRIDPAESAEEAVRFGDIVVTATSSRNPVVSGEWLQPGAHVNAIGANMANRREMDNAALNRARLITVDAIDQAHDEAGDLIQGLPAIGRSWDTVAEFHEVITPGGPRRDSDEDITIFKSCGIAIWDVAVAGFAYREALRKGKGSVMRIWGK